MSTNNNEQAQMFKIIDEGFTDVLYGEVRLQYKKISVQGAEYIAKKKFERIKRVDLARCELTDIGCRFIVTAKWDTISSINLSNDRLTNRACKYLSQAQWPTLQELDLGGNDIEDAGLMHLTKANFKSLRSLNIYDIKFVNGIRILSKSDWRALESLYSYCNTSNQLLLTSAVLCQWNSVNTIWTRPKNYTSPQIDRLNTFLTKRFSLLRSVNLR